MELKCKIYWPLLLLFDDLSVLSLRYDIALGYILVQTKCRLNQKTDVDRETNSCFYLYNDIEMRCMLHVCGE